MTAPTGTSFACPPGLIVCTTWGLIRHETATWLMEGRSHAEKQGMANVEWRFVPGSLVDKARNDAARSLLATNREWLLFVDGDMTGQPDAFLNLVYAAYALRPEADIMGGYCPLRGDLALPTLDTGTGTWESHFPGNGIVEVMRTGAAFILVKRHVYEKMPQPWYAVRSTTRPLDALAELDNLAHILFDGRNPLRGQASGAWEALESHILEHQSTKQPPWQPGEVGEDSAFCDAAKLAGFRIFVQTDVSLGHVTTKVSTWQDHKQAMERMQREQLALVGVGPIQV